MALLERSIVRGSLALLAASACFYSPAGSTTTTVTGTTTGDGPPDVVTSSSTTGAVTTSTTGTTTSGGVNVTTGMNTTSPGTTGLAAYCGDGVIDVDEQCDDGPLNGPDQPCSTECLLNPAATTSTGTTGEPSMLGDLCGGDDLLYCENTGPGIAGTLLRCVAGQWTLADLQEVFVPLMDFCPIAMMVNPTAVACTADVGGGSGISAVCSGDPPVACQMSDIGCDDGGIISLCIDDGRGGQQQLKGICAGACANEGEGPYCQDV